MGYPYQHANYGDYYMGDPGLFGFLGKVVKKVGGAVASALPGPAGTVARTIIGGGGPPTVPQIPVPSGFPGAVPVPGLAGLGQRLVPGGASGYQTGACPPGYHKNKALARYERAVAMGKQVKMPNVVNVCVKHRSFNPMNPRALRRAVRREGAAIGLLRESIKGSGYSVKRSGLPKAKKRR